MRTERIVEESVEIRSACVEGTGRNPGEYVLGAMVCPRAGGRSDPEAQELLEQIVASENMRKAWKRVKRNKGAPGVDGRTIDETADLLRQYWEEIKERLMDGTYRPQPAVRVEIPKAGGGMRKLGVPTVLDRLIQQAVHQILSPLFEPGFSEASYGFRPGRSAQDAVRAARAYQRDGKRWVVDIDLKAFFDEVDHDLLMGRVRRRLRLILWRQWKRWRTRYKRLVARGLAETRARKSACNGRGAWWNSGASHMNDAIRKNYFDPHGLVNLLETLQRNRIA